MPIYEYICSECDAKFEQLRPLSQSAKAVDCPRCHKPARRKMSTFACFSATSGSVSQNDCRYQRPRLLKLHLR